MTERLRVGLVGAGPWARKVHAPGLLAHPATELTAVWARRPDAAAELGAPVAREVDELLERVDAVAFAVPPATQAELARRAVDAGKHVILEKPIAPTVPEGEELVRRVEAAGVVSTVVFTRRFAAETVAWLADIHGTTGWAGGNVRWLSGALLSGVYSESAWRHEGGALADIGPHVVDLLDAALGPVTEVVAAHRSEPDLWNVVLRHESGATSAATMSMRLPMRPTITEVSVYGSEGERSLSGRETPPQEAYAALLDDFTDRVRTSRPDHPLNAARGLHVQRTLEAITRALGATPGTAPASPAP